MSNVDPIRPKGNSFHIKNFNPTACRLDELHHCNSRAAPRTGRRRARTLRHNRARARWWRDLGPDRRHDSARAPPGRGPGQEAGGRRQAAGGGRRAAGGGKEKGPAPLGGWGGTRSCPLGRWGQLRTMRGGSRRPRRARRPRRWNPPGSPSATRIEERSRLTTDKTDSAAGGFAARPGYSAWPVRARRTSTSTGTSAVDVVGRDDRPPRSNCCPVARPPSHTEITAMSAPAMSSAM